MTSPEARCQCQDTSHGHAAGDCANNAAANDEQLCVDCYEHLLRTRSTAAHTPFGQGPER